MNTTTIITLAVAVLIVFGLALVLTSVKRNDARGVGTLKRETRRKDVGKVNPDEVSGRAIERAAVAARNTAIATRPAQMLNHGLHQTLKQLVWLDDSS